MNRYVKVEGHSNWFLVLEPNSDIDFEQLASDNQEKILRSEVCTLHGDVSNATEGELVIQRIIKAATHAIDYRELVDKYGTILVRPIGSFMLLRGNEITNEKIDSHYPIDDFADIVICENDQHSEYKWRTYLSNRFPNKTITTINYFDLRSEEEVAEYFNNAEYVTFSTTFSKIEWYEKMARNLVGANKVIGYSHDESKWNSALEIFNEVEIVNELT